MRMAKTDLKIPLERLYVVCERMLMLRPRCLKPRPYYRDDSSPYVCRHFRNLQEEGISGVGVCLQKS
jgi:hypothetical protein